MNNVNVDFIRADGIIEKYIREDKVFEERLEAQYNNMLEYIEQSGYHGKLEVNTSVLADTMIDFFEDIQRLKVFHQIEDVNSIKIVAYMSYWILRHRPIQILDQQREYIYANERYVYSYIMDFLNKPINNSDGMSENNNIYANQRRGMVTFRESLLYYLKYRCKDAAGLEMILMSFFAGQIYQEEEEDLSNILSNKYKG